MLHRDTPTTPGQIRLPTRDIVPSLRPANNHQPREVDAAKERRRHGRTTLYFRL